MPVLHLGVVDIPYTQRASSKKTKKVASGTQTTGDVAEWLEAKYGVMDAFYNSNKSDISIVLEEAVSVELENLLMGRPINKNAFGNKVDAVQKLFADFLDTHQAERVITKGKVPTDAAIRGVNHRMKNNKGTPGRPSFVDTGLYQSSFKAWVD